MLRFKNRSATGKTSITGRSRRKDSIGGMPLSGGGPLHLDSGKTSPCFIRISIFLTFIKSCMGLPARTRKLAS